MIGKVKGILSEIDHNTGIIDTAGGVGYLLFLSPRILSHYKLNDQISLYTYLQVREDAQVLFGFETKEEYAFFKILLTVPGVGPKTAYTVISYAKTDELINAVKQNDIAYFSHIPGLGKKTSMKIILELSQK
jgi:Holliday junction DNA helicase RuvA